LDVIIKNLKKYLGSLAKLGNENDQKPERKPTNKAYRNVNTLIELRTTHINLNKNNSNRIKYFLYVLLMWFTKHIESTSKELTDIY
jgi:hypothetical protein